MNNEVCRGFCPDLMQGHGFMKKRIFVRLAVVFCSLFFVAVGVFAMSLGDVGKVCLFSAISGTITLDGKPVVNARLVRTGDRAGPIVDETVTDEKGYFEFPVMFERTITKFLPQEFVASQKVVVVHNNKNYQIWSSVKRNPEENVEAKGKPLVVTCELNSEEKSIVVDRVPIHSLCVWDVEPDAPINWDEL
jgi:hypothetical protein